MIETTLNIDGMTCEHCERTVDAAVAEQPGVRSVTVDAALGVAIVTHAAPLDVEAIRVVLDDAGYSLRP